MVPLNDIKSRTIKQLAKKSDTVSGIQRIELPVQNIDLIAWLNHQTFERKTYCAGRDDQFKIAGVGAAYTIHSDRGNLNSLFTKLEQQLRDSDEHVRFYGGIKFDSTTPISRPWKSFGIYHFTVPRFELVKRADQTFFAVNLVKGEEHDLNDIRDQLDQLNFDDSTPKADLPQYVESISNPDKENWVRNVEHALELIKKGEMNKIVLSGQLDLRFKESINPALLLQKLVGQNSNSFHFFFQTGRENAFMGITPERLYRREGREIRSEAIAGTRPRNVDAVIDAALAHELQNSDKDIREHRWVSDMVQSGLKPLCKEVHMLDKEQIIKLRHVQHLQTLIKGILKDDIYDSEILSHLHPTPAVGGYPNNIALRNIAGIEGFDRGWYAGPVGWVSKDTTGFAVGIRSGLVNRNNLTLFAGSGIVEGSDPDKEWEENQTKLLNFTKLFQ